MEWLLQLETVQFFALVILAGFCFGAGRWAGEAIPAAISQYIKIQTYRRKLRKFSKELAGSIEETFNQIMKEESSDEKCDCEECKCKSMPDYDPEISLKT